MLIMPQGVGTLKASAVTGHADAKRASNHAPTNKQLCADTSAPYICTSLVQKVPGDIDQWRKQQQWLQLGQQSHRAPATAIANVSATTVGDRQGLSTQEAAGWKRPRA